MVIEDWSLSCFFDETIGNIWGGQVVLKKDGNYTIQNAGYNQNINPGEVVTVGFTVSEREGQNQPMDFALWEVN